MNIGEAAANTGVPAKTIRYYEDIGLVQPPRTASGYRTFGPAELEALTFVGRARSLGFSVADCSVLLALERDRTRASHDVKAVAERHLARIATKLVELAAMRDRLENLVARCRGDDRADCPIIDDLSGPNSPR